MRTLLFALLLPTAAFSYQLRKDVTGATVEWKAAVRFVAQPGFDDAIAADGALAALQASAATWSVNGPSVTIEEGATTGVGFSLQGNNQNEVVLLDVWPFDAKAIASTVVTVNRTTHTIIDADIAFNRQSNRFGVLAGGSVRGGQLDDVQNTMTHELGHALGLAHDETQPSAVMYPEAYSGEVNKRTLSDDDMAGVQALYGAAVKPAGALTESTQQGCQAAAGGPALLALASLLRSRRMLKRLAALGLAVSTAAIAQPGHQRESNRAVVQYARTHAEQGLFITELELQSDSGKLTTVKVYGGRIGEFEQIVGGEVVPAEGDEVALPSN